MSNAGSDFVHVAATRSIGHGTPSTSRSEPASADSEHIRIGRSLVKVKRYQNEASRGSRWPPTSPTSPASPTPLTPIPSPTEGTIQERAFKRKWFQPPFIRRRNVSLGGISPGGDDLLVPAKRGEIRSWVSGQPHHGMWVSASQDDLDVRPASATIHI
ncbi:hypothetical protein FS749_005661 [Ceratobasidium sp. UAMH 11750]|nr:hypothetical protein FS749_005661 [Ceratobasidium sp. UAMH 11750]